MDELLLLILCSPSGAGKTTLTREILTELPEMTFSVSHTTRPPREGEEDGVAYHFVDHARFEEMVAEGRFAEWAEVHGNCYGTSVDELERAKGDGKRGIVFDIDHQGARQIKAKLPHAVGLFVLPPSMDELRRRLVARASDAPEVIERRFAVARDEIAHYPFFDYLVVNDDLEEAKATVVSIVRAEMARRWRLAPLAETLLRSSHVPR